MCPTRSRGEKEATEMSKASGGDSTALAVS